MSQDRIKEYYSQPEVSRFILKFCENRETIPVYRKNIFGKRPDAIPYPKDFETLLNNGATVFLGSLERWANPHHLRTEMKRDELDKLRTGWDMVIDIDCDRELSYAKKAALIVLDMLETYGIQNYTVKFSGSRGFHITLPFEIFPKKFEGKLTKKQFPELPRMLMDYIIDFTRKGMRKEFNEDPDKILTLDRGVIAPRHLVRVPYSLHLKTGLASIYLTREQLANFEPEHAKPENVKVAEPKIKPNGSEISELIEAAKFWESGKAKKPEYSATKSNFKPIDKAIDTSNFPPCITRILNGLEDGRKRSVFLLITFLAHTGWSQKQISSLLTRWNTGNRPQLEESHISFTIRNQFSRNEPQMAPNCSNKAYYKDLGLCTPNKFCEHIRNPVTYTLKRAKARGKKFRRDKHV